MTAKELGALIERRRRLLGISLETLAEYGDTSAGVVSRWEHGQCLRTHLTLLAVLERLGVELEQEALERCTGGMRLQPEDPAPG